MSEWHVTLYGEDAERARELRERLNEELPGSISSNAELVRTCFDLAEDARPKQRP
jgi:hypothetical protein